jgi:hypothetical protein
MPCPTVEAIVLLGWLERGAAIAYLCQNCVFDSPLSTEEAASIWQQYRARVDEIPERSPKIPQRLSLTREEQEAAAKFMSFHRSSGGGANILDVLKVDPMGLVIHQLHIVLDRSREYMKHSQAKTWCSKNCLSLPSPSGHQVQIQGGINRVDVQVPHAEFVFSFVPDRGLQICETARHVSVGMFDDRMLLWAGYHRSYARIANPEAIDRSLLVVLTTDSDFFFSPDSPNQGLRDTLRGSRPPLFADFFDDRFFMRVRLRKKRFELRIRADLAQLDLEA